MIFLRFQLCVLVICSSSIISSCNDFEILHNTKFQNRFAHCTFHNYFPSSRLSTFCNFTINLVFPFFVLKCIPHWQSFLQHKYIILIVVFFICFVCLLSYWNTPLTSYFIGMLSSFHSYVFVISIRHNVWRGSVLINLFIVLWWH